MRSSSAAIYMLRLGPLRVLREPRWLVFGVASAVLIVTWIGWSLVQYGSAITFGSHTTVMGSRGHDGWHAAVRWALNLWSTVVPHWFRAVDLKILTQDDIWGYWRDAVFLVVQTNLLGALGLTAGVLFLFAVVNELRRGAMGEPHWRFWAGILVSIIVLAMLVNEQVEPFGSVHICLQPLVLLGLVRLAALCQRYGTVFRACFGAGLGCGYLFGILLHYWYQAVNYDGQAAQLAKASVGTRENWLIKEKLKLDFLGDWPAAYQPALFVIEVAMAVLLLAAFYRYGFRRDRSEAD